MKKVIISTCFSVIILGFSQAALATSITNPCQAAWQQSYAKKISIKKGTEQTPACTATNMLTTPNNKNCNLTLTCITINPIENTQGEKQFNCTGMSLLTLSNLVYKPASGQLLDPSVPITPSPQVPSSICTVATPTESTTAQ